MAGLAERRIHRRGDTARNESSLGAPAINGIGRQIHGQVGVMVGTNGARGVAASMYAPLGETGHVAVAFENTRFGSRY
ncbi:MAG: hypothetical protein EOP61_23870 [Sphingomonadales bacterium]|nr:MAG: hypothetical protein EOP61_23870 [Sphingomonadales bacterium]